MTDAELEVIVFKYLDAFYARRIQKLQGLQLTDTLKRKNPYLFRAIGIQKASELVEGLLQAYMSSSDEGIFGDAFFEPLAKDVSAGQISPTEGVDVVLETVTTYTAIAVKSGPAVFNAQSKRRQEDEFRALRSRMLKTQKQFEAIVGYAYGRKVSPASAKKSFAELSGQVFWERLTGDPEFYLKIIRAMRERPAMHRAEFDAAWAAAINRFTMQFVTGFCHQDGSIDWERLTAFNSGRTQGE